MSAPTGAAPLPELLGAFGMSADEPVQRFVFAATAVQLAELVGLGTNA